MSALTYNCPSCGAPLTFTSSIAVSMVCSYCSSLVVRRDVNVEALGKVAQLPPDLSPLQIGTTGTFKGLAFRLAGRLRWQWEGGSWTEWYAETNKGTRWLAETQGFFIFTSPAAEGSLPNADTLSAGDSVSIGGMHMRVVDVRTATCVAAEGELPEVVPQGTERFSADLQNYAGEFASIEAMGGAPELYTGRYATFDDCQFANLRAVPGWSAEALQAASDATQSFACASCGAPVTIRASGLTMSAVCGSCGSIVDAASEQHRVLEEAHEATSHNLALPIGKRGKLRDVEWEVIGWVRRSDVYSRWDEYLLFNPWKGFVWLVTYNGHWAIIDRLLRIPEHSEKKAKLDARDYKHFSSYQSSVIHVLGEFYWQVATGEQTQVADYVAPPYVLSSESYGEHEVTWSHGEYVDHSVIAKAFEVKLAKPTGLWLNQPNPFAERRQGITKFVIAFLALFAVLYAQGPTLRPLTSGDYNFDRSSGVNVFTTEPFELSRDSNRVQVDATAWVNNQWVDFDFALVNDATGERFEGDVGIGFWQGYEDGESWTEGSTEGMEQFSAIDRGRYRLVIEPEVDPSMQELHFEVKVSQGGFFASSFYLTLLAILGYPVLMLVRQLRFEHRRWADSDSAASEDDD